MQKMYLEHFCLLIPTEWSAVFNKSSRSQALKKILMIFLIKSQAVWLFHLTRYWFPRGRFPVKSSVPKVAAKSLNIFEFQVLVKLQAFTKNYLFFLIFFQGVLKADLEILSDLRWYFEAVVNGCKLLSIFAKGFHLLTSKVSESTSAIYLYSQAETGVAPEKILS